VSEHSNIAIVIHALSGGGSEHVAAMMANHWSSLGRTVTLVTLDAVSGDTIAVAADVRRIGLDLQSESTNPLSALFANLRRTRALRSALVASQATRVISLTDRMNVLTILACRGTGLRPIVAERTDPRHHAIGRVWDFLRRRAYPRAGAIVVQTESVRRAILPFTGRCPVHVIPNAVTDPEENERTGDPSPINLSPDRKWIAGLGRLSTEKGFDRLIAGFASVAEQHPDWNLVIVGDGPARKELESQVAGCGLTDRVRLTGWVEQPWPLLHNCSVFVLPSRYEGFPNALLEAMARGKACIATDCQSGPAEIIESGVNGLLVNAHCSDDMPAALGTALDSLLSSHTLRMSVGQQAKHVLVDFGTDPHFRAWDQIDV